MKTWIIEDAPSFQGKDVPWFNDPNAPKYPGIDWSRPTPFILKMMAEHPEDKEAFEKVEDGPNPALLFAPDCLPRNGKYYLYFCMPDDSEGVAVSNSPNGPFANPIQLPCGGIDPAVFIDDDGQAYLYWGQLFSHGVKLNRDMVSFDRNGNVDELVTEETHCFHEGSSMRKIGDTYYYVYADIERGKPTALGYSTGKSPLGPFTYRGIIVDNAPCDPASWNNHGSIECFNGQWYVFYHRCSRGVQQHRRLCIEKINILPDGRIPEVKMTSQGIGEPFAPGEKIMGYQACELKGHCRIDVDPIGPYPKKLTGIADGDEAVFRYVKSDTPWTGLSVTARGTGIVRVTMNGQDAGMLSLRPGTAMGSLCMPAGEYELRLAFSDVNDLDILDLTLT